MIKEFERVVLLKDLKGTSFVKGDVGTIVTEHPGKKTYEVEFFALDGTTLGVETVTSDQIKSVNGIKKVIHVDTISAE
jgi:hypothetical protein